MNAFLRGSGAVVVRSLAWPVRSPMRFLIFVWLMGFLTVGWVQHAAADGIIVGPDLGANGDALTVFERIGPSSFNFYQRLSESEHGFPYITETMWVVLNFLADVVMFMLALLSQGAITSLQWMLNLSLYQDNKFAIDGVVQSVAAQVYWPLFATSLAIGAAVAYGRMKREGNGSLFSDAAWMVATAVFAGAFVLSASNVLDDLDKARTLVSDGMLTGYASSDIASQSAAGFPAVELPATTQGATRQLSDAMWNTSVVAPWCYAQFGSLDDCKNVGADYLTQSPRWQEIDRWMEQNPGDTDGAQCPPEISNCDWLRGQSASRLGAVLFAAAVSLPQDIVQLGLAIFGIMAIVTFLLLILVGAFFVLLWPIPGKPREIGTKWFMELIGALLQSIIITAVIGAVMVLSGLLTLAIPKYGLFGAAVLQIATMIAGWRLRGTMENILGVGGGQASPFSSYMAMRALGSVGRTMGKGLGATRKAGMFTAKTGMKGAEGVFNAAYRSPDTFKRGANAVQSGAQRSRAALGKAGERLLPPRPFVSSPASPAPAAATSGAGAAAGAAGGAGVGTAAAVGERIPRVREGGTAGATRTTPGLNTPTRGATATLPRPARTFDSPPPPRPTGGRGTGTPAGSRALRPPRAVPAADTTPTSAGRTGTAGGGTAPAPGPRAPRPEAARSTSPRAPRHAASDPAPAAPQPQQPTSRAPRPPRADAPPSPPRPGASDSPRPPRSDSPPAPERPGSGSPRPRATPQDRTRSTDSPATPPPRSRFRRNRGDQQ